MSVDTLKCDVLVVGAGIAGICASLKAAETGADVIIATRDRVCSGSSFWGSTWGLGLVGPYDESEESIRDFIDEICSVGLGIADRDLVEKLVRDIGPGLEWLRGKGFIVREPSESAKNDRTYVPCFDKKVRGWHGLATHESVDSLRKNMDETEIRKLEKAALVDLYVDDEGAVSGALFVQDDEFVYVQASAIVLASGGMSGLFEGHLSADDSDGTATAFALLAGATLANIEFLQQMVAYDTPVGPVVFNEKLWRDTVLLHAETGENVFESYQWTRDRYEPCFDSHAWHGPFTTARDSRYIETMISRANEQDGCMARVDLDLDSAPEFVKVYANWLMESHGMNIQDPHPVYVAMQASNGGIRVDASGRTGVLGLLAAGEATGGYHGADRIGGLASATAMVSGISAGDTASAIAKSRKAGKEGKLVLELNGKERIYDADELSAVTHEATLALAGSRNADQMGDVANRIRELLRRYEGNESPYEASPNIAAENTLSYARLLSTLSILEAAIRRNETRGSHYRSDCPAPDESYARPSALKLSEILK